jgi:hypothetical protein
VIREVTEALIDLIASKTPESPGWVLATSLHGGATASTEPKINKLHICLYAVEEHGHLRNQPPVLTPDGYRRPPLALRLHYLMTYLSDEHLESQARLAKVAEIFYDTPILGPELLRPELAEKVGRITVRMRNPGAEERSQVWTGLGRPMRLALYYDVDVAPIESQLDEGAGTIRRRDIDYLVVPTT